MWWALAAAIAVEVCATLSLRASDGFRRKRWLIPVIAGGCAVVLAAGGIGGHLR